MPVVVDLDPEEGLSFFVGHAHHHHEEEEERIADQK
jgi:hypothetical protein